MSDNDIVTITCYYETEKMTRKEAIDFYENCAENSDGNEHRRYMNILDGLRAGLMKVDDNEGD